MNEAEFERDAQPIPAPNRSACIEGNALDGEHVPEFDELAADGLASVRRPGPGLPESIGWCFGIMVIQVTLQSFAIVIDAIVTHRPVPQVASEVQSAGSTESLLVFGLPLSVAFLFLIGLALLRLGRTPLRKVNLAKPSRTQFLLVCSCVVPLGFVADGTASIAQQIWDEIVRRFPPLGVLDQSTINDFMASMEGGPLLLILFCIAVTPAIGEEFMLRGLVGRGLVARWGVVWGVLFTSFLFAALHIHPVHAAAVFPLGLMMHIIYLTTRSFWMPVLFHFLNNAMASLVAWAGYGGEEQPGMLWRMILGLLYGGFICWALWRSRAHYQDGSGRSFDPGYKTVEQPPASSGYRRVAPESMLMGSIAAVLLVGQIAVIAYDFVAPTPAQNVEQAPPANAEAAK